MTTSRSQLNRAFAWIVSLGALFAASGAVAQTTGVSQVVTWTCHGSSCPWGESTSNPALVWPEEAQAIDVRHDYTTSAPMYLPASVANGTIIWIDSGYATAYAGTPTGSHRAVAYINVGEFYEVSGLEPDEVLSIQSDATFTYQIDLGSAPPPQDPEGPEDPEDPQDPPVDPGVSGTAADWVTWNCAGSICPWGGSTANYALTWPTAGHPISTRYDYTTTKPIYLPAGYANGASITVTSGTATAYAGSPDASHHAVVTISAGQTQPISGLQPGEVLSVQSDYAFSFEVTLGTPPTEPEEEPTDPGEPGSPSSKLVVWNCTSTPCPWGETSTSHAIVWPETAQPSSARFGYTATDGVYLAYNRANGATIWIDSGFATVYAGTPNGASHRALAYLSVGEFYEVSGVAPGEIVSVQSDSAFTYQIDLPTPAPEEPTDPGIPATSATVVTWNCMNENFCPWGVSTTGYAVNWGSGTDAVNRRLGYTTSHGIYLPAERANGAVVTADSGQVSLFAGRPDEQSHRNVGVLVPGQSITVSGLKAGEVLSAQSDYAFTFHVSVPDSATPAPSDGSIYSVLASWKCNVPDCGAADWVGSTLTWPSWAAYSTNDRSGDRSRTAYGSDGNLLYPYMGSWANGCQVTAKTGNVLIIEWQRGEDVWRETWLTPGETYTIQLISPEDGALIEAEDYSPGFSVALSNCTPQPLN